MADDVKPGTDTSEYKLTKVLIVLGAIITAASAALAALHTSLPDAKWVAVAMAVVGPVTSLLSALGYNNGRVAQKLAATNPADTTVTTAVATTTTTNP